MEQPAQSGFGQYPQSRNPEENRLGQRGRQIICFHYPGFSLLLAASKKLNLIRFILNNREVSAGLPPGTLLLDYLRYDQNLTATKIGCREGDCGACTVLIGDTEEGHFRYRSATSCLTALGNVHGRHVLTLEGLNGEGLTPVQQAFADCSASQCGFCTPGFVVSLSGYCLGSEPLTAERARAAIGGNICRCTGYKSIERAVMAVCRNLPDTGTRPRLEELCRQGAFPAWLTGIPERILQLKTRLNGALKPQTDSPRFLGGGTDLYVQQHEAMTVADIAFLNPASTPMGEPSLQSGWVEFPGNTTVTRMLEFEPFRAAFTDWKNLEYLISSEPIRNLATLAGNLANASPIGDLSIFFLAAGAHLELCGPEGTRHLPLRDFFTGYKTLNRKEGEWIRRIQIPEKAGSTVFEKTCKRQCLDIASVNSALWLEIAPDRTITNAGLAAGGVAPVPLYLRKSSEWLCGKPAGPNTLARLLPLVQEEVRPISDVRGSESYKRLLLSQQIKSLFGRCVPELSVTEVMYPGE